MAAQSGDSGAPNLSIKLGDLASASQLKKLLQGDAAPTLKFATELVEYWDKPVKNAPKGTSAGITITGSGNWKTKTGIGFGLSGDTKCSVRLVTTGAVIKYAADLKSDPTTEMPAVPYAGAAYIVVTLDFKISESVSGGGQAGALGITGNVKGSEDESVIFCHCVADSTDLGTAIQETLEKFVFAFEPSCAADMSVGDIAQVNFSGSLGCGLSVTYGISTVTFAAPGVASVLDSASKGTQQFTLPSGKLAIGASATVSYTHSDDFTAVVQKLDANDAFLYVMRAHKNDEGEGAKVSAKVTITNSTGVKVDAQKLAEGVNKVTGLGGQQAALMAGSVEQGLSGKLDSWIRDEAKQGSSLGVEWDQHRAVSMLYRYQIKLGDGSVEPSWNALCNGDLVEAVTSGGLVPEAGSGVSQEISHSFTVGLQIFNLFSVANKTTYFEKSYVTVTAKGDLQYQYDIGKESEVDVKKSKNVCRIHFVVTIDETTAQPIPPALIDLEVEISAANDKKAAGRINELMGTLPANPQVSQLLQAIQNFMVATPTGTLDLVCVLAQAAYGRLSCSPYVDGKPPTLDKQTEDAANWRCFQHAVVTLLKLEFVSRLRYSDWQTFNVICNEGPDHPGIPNRRLQGNPQEVPSSWWGNFGVMPTLGSGVLLSTAEFMNLCDDLHRLGSMAGAPQTASDDAGVYDGLLLSLMKLIVKNDVNTDYSEPAISALLQLANPEDIYGKCVTAKNSLTCTLKLN